LSGTLPSSLASLTALTTLCARGGGACDAQARADAARLQQLAEQLFGRPNPKLERFRAGPVARHVRPRLGGVGSSVL